MYNIRVKRIYDDKEKDDGARILADRLWPRGVSRKNADLFEWWKDIAPSTDLRRWFRHSGGKFDEFRRRYKNELSLSQIVAVRMKTVHKLLLKGNITFVYASKDREKNNAVVLKEWIDENLDEK